MLEGINSRITEEEWMNDLEDRMVEITATEQNTEKRMKINEDSLRHLWDNIKCIHIIGIIERKERKKVPGKIFEEIIAENEREREIMAENVPSTGKEIVNQVQAAQRVPGRINPRRNTLRYILIKLTKIKDKILKATKEK